jgi:hypothetical protein
MSCELKVWVVVEAWFDFVVWVATGTCDAGVKFPTPQMDETRAPIFTPSDPEKPPVRKPPSTATSTGGTKPPKLPGQLEALDNAITMLSDIVAAAESKEDLASNDIAAELMATLVTSEPRLVEMISVMTISGEASHGGVSLEVLLTLNDALHKVMEEYAHVTKHGPKPKSVPTAPARNSATAPAPAPAPAPVDVFDDFFDTKRKLLVLPVLSPRICKQETVWFPFALLVGMQPPSQRRRFLSRQSDVHRCRRRIWRRQRHQHRQCYGLL